jgi:hypothetical protein
MNDPDRYVPQRHTGFPVIAMNPMENPGIKEPLQACLAAPNSRHRIADKPDFISAFYNTRIL